MNRLSPDWIVRHYGDSKYSADIEAAALEIAREMDDDDDNDGSMESLVQEMGTNEQIRFIIDHLGPFKAKSVLSKCRRMDEGMEEESEDDDDLRTLSFLTVKIGRVTCTEPAYRMEAVTQNDDREIYLTIYTSGPYMATINANTAADGRRIEQLPNSKVSLAHNYPGGLLTTMEICGADLGALPSLSLRFHDPQELIASILTLRKTLYPEKDFQAGVRVESEVVPKITGMVLQAALAIRDSDAADCSPSDSRLHLQGIGEKGITVRDRIDEFLLTPADKLGYDPEGSVQHALQALRKAQSTTIRWEVMDILCNFSGATAALKTLEEKLPWKRNHLEGMARWLNKFVEYRLYMPALARGLKLIKGRNGLADEEAFKELKAAGLAHEEKDLVLLQLFAGENLVQSKSAVFPPPPPPKPAPLPLINHEVLRLLIVANGVTIDQARPYFAKALKAGSEPSDHDIEAACQSVGGGVHDGLISSGNNGGIERLTPGQQTVLKVMRAAGGMGHEKALKQMLGKALSFTTLLTCPFIRQAAPKVYSLIGTPLTRIEELMEIGKDQHGNPFMRLPFDADQDLLYFPEFTSALQPGEYRNVETTLRVEGNTVQNLTSLRRPDHGTLRITFLPSYELQIETGTSLEDLCLAKLPAAPD